MGLLDDAIKQHLELKRRRGADPGEIERLEREALGPVRRVQAEEAPPRAEASVSYQEPGYVQEPYEEGELAAPYEEGEFAPNEEYEFEDEERELSSWTESAPGPASSAEPAPDPLSGHGALPPEPAAALEDLIESDVPEPAEPADHTGAETAEYDVEAEHAHRGGEEGKEGDDADMLEETPEFFQDAPDHDRLWFEQRPPKDFDFDG
jgi:hypothetical protein